MVSPETLAFVEEVKEEDMLLLLSMNRDTVNGSENIAATKKS